MHREDRRGTGWQRDAGAQSVAKVQPIDCNATGEPSGRLQTASRSEPKKTRTDAPCKGSGSKNRFPIRKSAMPSQAARHVGTSQKAVPHVQSAEKRWRMVAE